MRLPYQSVLLIFYFGCDSFLRYMAYYKKIYLRHNAYYVIRGKEETRDILNQNLRLNVAASSVRTVSKYGGIDEFLIRTKNKDLSSKAKKYQKVICDKSKRISQ